MDGLDEARGGAAGPQAAELVLERGDGRLHAPLEVVEIESRGHDVTCNLAPV